MKKYYVILFLLLLPSVANAVTIAAALDSLLVVDPNNAAINLDVEFGDKVAAANVAIGGEIQFNQQTTQLLSITPPEFKAGCGGISMHFGSMSFVDGDQIMQLLENAGPGVKAFFFELAFRALCGDCMETLKSIIDKIMQVNKLLRDSCSLGKAIGGALVNAVTTTQQETCNQEVANNGNAVSDGVQAHTDTCSSSQGAIDALKALFDDPPNGKKKKEELSCLAGNCTWQLFKTIGIVNTGAPLDAALAGPAAGLVESAGFGQLMMSVTGTYSEGKPVPATLDVGQVLNYLLCGQWSRNANITQANTPYVFNQCEAWMGSPGADIRILACSNPPSGPGLTNDVRFGKCDFVEAVSINSDWDPSFGGMDEGFLLRVHTLLNDAVANIRAGNPLSQPQKNLIAITPFPLYKMLNISAVYPAVSQRLIESYTLAISYMFASAYLDFSIKEGSKSRKSGTTHLPPQAMKIMQTMLLILDEKRNSSFAKISNSISTQNMLVDQLNKINNLMVNNIYDRGLLGNLAHTNELVQ